MTKERAQLILDIVLQWFALDPTRRTVTVDDWVGLKLSCGRLAAARTIKRAQQVLGMDTWNAATAGHGRTVEQPKPVDQVDAQGKPVRPEPPATPETERAKRMVTQNLQLLDFVRWLDARGRLKHLNPWNPEDWIAEFVGIDMDRLTAERKAILDYSAAMHRYWADLETWRNQGVRGK